MGLAHHNIVFTQGNQAKLNSYLSAEARYFWRWNLFSSSMICSLEKEVRGFLRFGGVRFWYG